MLMLLSRCALHLQIRLHAAAALANLGQRSLYGDLWEEALQTSYDAFVGLQNSEDGTDSSINAGMPQTALLCLQLLVVALQHIYAAACKHHLVILHGSSTEPCSHFNFLEFSCPGASWP